jgi:hypothetical protein
MNTGTDRSPDRPADRSSGCGEGGRVNDHPEESSGDREDTVPAQDTSVYQMQYRPASGSSLSTTIVRQIAELSSEPPTGMKPLYYTIDPDLLDSFVDGGSHEGSQLRFTYHGYEIHASADGEVRLRPLDS